MKDEVTVALGGKSQEEIALSITDRILFLRGSDKDPDALLKTYAEVLRVVRNPFQGQ